jgi:hypothetical protein
VFESNKIPKVVVALAEIQRVTAKAAFPIPKLTLPSIRIL